MDREQPLVNREQTISASLDHIGLILDRLLDDQIFPKEAAAFAYAPETVPLYEKSLELFNNFLEIKAYIDALSQGDIDIDAPPRRNHLAGSLKHFQAQLRHLIWQAECIARGNYNQKLDFMGALSEVFNKMSIQLKNREDQLKAQQHAMTRIFDKLDPIFIVETTKHRHILYANQMAQERFHIKEATCLASQNFTLPNNIFELPQDGTPTELADALAQHWYRITCSSFPWSNYQDSLLFHCVDITVQKRHADLLAQAANTDELTGLYNRRAFEFSSADVWDICLKTGSPLSVLIFDIDYFKKCNDSYGHQFGDTCLMTFARILSHVFSRSNDIVARYGGEEFIVALPFTSENIAVRLADKVRTYLENTPIPIPHGKDEAAHLTVSGGVACLIPDTLHTLESMIFTADQALYKAKQGGRNRIVSVDVSQMIPGNRNPVQ